MTTKKWALWLVVPFALLTLACGGGGDDTGEVTSGTNTAEADTTPRNEETPDGVYKFGQTVKFNDGSTLTVGKPEKFKRDQWAAGGQKMKVFLKFKATFTNNTDEVFDPALTTGSASADGVEGESVYQDGLDAPDNKVLPGKKVTWYMGYGFPSAKKVQLEVNIGFLTNYDTVIFTQ